jgi:tetratricopeptide (TPR) repeat protein
LIVVLFFTLVFVAAGFGVIYIVESKKGTSLLVSSPTTGTPLVQSIPKLTAPTPSPQADAGTSTSSSGDIKIREHAVTPEQKRDTLKPVREKKAVRKYAQKSAPHASSRVQEIKSKKAGARGHADSDRTSGGMTRQDKDMNLYMARTYEMQKNYQQALIHYKKVLAMEPNNYVLMNNIASMLIHLGSYEEAIGNAQKALNVRKSYVPSLINIGVGYGCLGKHSESESYFQKVLAVEPTHHHALLNLGLLYEKQGAFDNANRCFRRLAEGEDIQGYLGLARIAEKQKKIDDAVRFYRMALSMENINPHTANMVNERLVQLTK